MYGCESWTVKKAERCRIDAFELWCWRRLLRVPWTARRSNQSILKGISPGISLEGMRGLEGVPGLPGAPQEEAGLTRKFETSHVVFLELRRDSRVFSIIPFKEHPGLISFRMDWLDLLAVQGTHSSVLAWRIPGTGEPGGLRSIGSHRVGHD